MAHLGHYNAAIELFTEAIKLDPKDFRYVYEQQNTNISIIYLSSLSLGIEMKKNRDKNHNIF